jgi:hypothetical protein
MRSGTTLLAVFLVAVVCLVASCRKQHAGQGTVPVLTPAGTNITKELGNISLAEAQQALDGKWWLLNSSGGFAGQSRTFNGIYHIFGKKVFTINDNGNVDEYKCTWENVKSIHSGDRVYQLSYNGGGVSMCFLRIINDTLYTSDNAYDGFGNTYLKIK